MPKVGGTKDVNLAKLRRLAPTHVLLNVDENRLDTAEALQSLGAEMVVTHPCGPQDNLGADRPAGPGVSATSRAWPNGRSAARGDSVEELAAHPGPDVTARAGCCT